MKPMILLILLTLGACSSAPVTFSKPPKDAAVWNLNPGSWPGTNDLIREPVWSH